MNPLYIKDNAGNIRYWVCTPLDDGLELEYGVLNGTPQFKFEPIDFGKAGRDQEEQIQSRVNSRINKQLDKGYTYSLDMAKSMKPVNALGFVKPMLAKKKADVDISVMVTKPYALQYKLDGNRCLIHNDGTGLVAYSRNGKEFKTLDHILNKLEGKIPAGYTLDGELYIHNTPLQTIVGLCKKKQAGTEKVRFNCYDLVSDSSFEDRYSELKRLLGGVIADSYATTKLVDTLFVNPDENKVCVDEEFKRARCNGYEGLMFRSGYSLNRGVLVPVGYEDGKRSGSLIKFKEFDNKEFTIVDITCTPDGWAMLHFKAENGKPFSATCCGEVVFKKYVYENKADYIGLPCSIDFAYYTIEGIPFQPVATAIRDYE